MAVAFLVPEACDIQSVMLKLLVAQVGVGAVLAVVLWSIFGDVVGYSALLGSLVCVIPNAFLALRLALPRRDPGAQSLVRAAHIGELGKLALTVLFFSLVFTLVKPLVRAAHIGELGKLALTVLFFSLVFTLVKPLSAAALFAAFIATQLVTLTGLLMRHEQEQDKRNGNGS